MARPVFKWLIIQLYENCDQEKQLPTIRYEIISAFGKNTEFYIPVHSERIGEKIIYTSLFEGYVFVKIMKDMDVHLCVDRIRGVCLDGPVQSSGGFHYVSNSEIVRYRKRMDKKLKSFIPDVGQSVMGKIGTFRNTIGEVVAVNLRNREAQVLFKMRSREVTATLDTLNLVPITEKDHEG